MSFLFIFIMNIFGEYMAARALDTASPSQGNNSQPAPREEARSHGRHTIGSLIHADNEHMPRALHTVASITDMDSVSVREEAARTEHAYQTYGAVKAKGGKVNVYQSIENGPFYKIGDITYPGRK